MQLDVETCCPRGASVRMGLRRTHALQAAPLTHRTWLCRTCCSMAESCRICACAAMDAAMRPCSCQAISVGSTRPRETCRGEGSMQAEQLIHKACTVVEWCGTCIGASQLRQASQRLVQRGPLGSQTHDAQPWRPASAPAQPPNLPCTPTAGWLPPQVRLFGHWQRVPPTPLLRGARTQWPQWCPHCWGAAPKSRCMLQQGAQRGSRACWLGAGPWATLGAAPAGQGGCFGSRPATCCAHSTERAACWPVQQEPQSPCQGMQQRQQQQQHYATPERLRRMSRASAGACSIRWCTGGSRRNVATNGPIVHEIPSSCK